MKGSYCLLIKVSRGSIIRTGKLGKIKFRKGMYVYVGSALNNLEKRVARHLRKRKKKRWHIDYLLANKNVRVKKVYFRESDKKEECKIARALAKNGEGVGGVGCSDCKCRSHLFKLSRIENIKKLNMEVLNVRI